MEIIKDTELTTIEELLVNLKATIHIPGWLVFYKGGGVLAGVDWHKYNFSLRRSFGSRYVGRCVGNGWG